MLFKRSYKTAAITFVIAATTGFVMQNGDALASRFATAQPQVPASESIETAQNLTIKMPAAPVLPNQPATPDLLNRSEQGFSSPKLSSDQAYSALGLDCGVSFAATKALGGNGDA